MRARTPAWTAASVVVLAGAVLAVHEPARSSSPAQATVDGATVDGAMAEAAQTVLGRLDGRQRDRMHLPFESGERTNWHYVPRARNGLPLEAMTEAQREAVHALLQSALSRPGYEKVWGIVELEGILGQLSDRPSFRDPENYYLTIFGTPSTDAPWGWRFEGHHLSLNVSSVTDTLVAATPAFLGANPAEVPSGDQAGRRVLADEEDLARRLLALLDAAQRERALIAPTAPSDILTAAHRTVQLDRFEGLPAAAMDEAQRAALMRLVEAYTHTLRPDLAAVYTARLRATGLDSLHFAWAGGTRPGERHYYRIYSPALLIEYDETQPNHVHTVWRDPTNDFGDDLLRRHYETHSHQ